MTVNRTLAPVAALLLSVAILLTGQGLQFALLPVRASLESFPPLAIGIMGAAYFFGFTVGCLRGGELVRRVGHVRVFLAMTAIASAAPLIHVLAVNPVAWAILRMATGFCFATLYVVIESWLNDRATNENRGLIFSTYSMITLSVMAAGQMSLLLYPPSGAELFIIASVLVSFGAVPVALSTSPSPELPTQVSIDLRRLMKVSPSGTLGCFATGLANGAFWSLAPVFATRIGGVEMAAVFMTAAVVGGAAAQWPLGILSDKWERRKTLVAIAVVGSIMGTALAMFASTIGALPLYLLGALWGAMAFPLYAIAVAYANDFAEPGEHVNLSSGLLLVYGIGATVGPFVASALMGTEGVGILFSFAAFVHIGLVCIVVVRYLRRRSVAEQPIEFADALALAQTASQIYEEEFQNDQTKDPSTETVSQAPEPE